MLCSENPDFVVKEKKTKKVGLEDQLKRKSVDGKKGRGPAKKKRSAVSDIQEELPEAEHEEEPEEDDDSVDEEIASPAPARRTSSSSSSSSSSSVPKMTRNARDKVIAKRTV